MMTKPHNNLNYIKKSSNDNDTAVGQLLLPQLFFILNFKEQRHGKD